MKLNELIAQYVAFRKSLGEGFESAEILLKTFCRRMGEDIDLADVTAEHVLVAHQLCRLGYACLRGAVHHFADTKFTDLHHCLSFGIARLPLDELRAGAG